MCHICVHFYLNTWPSPCASLNSPAMAITLAPPNHGALLPIRVARYTTHAPRLPTGACCLARPSLPVQTHPSDPLKTLSFSNAVCYDYIRVRGLSVALVPLLLCCVTNIIHYNHSIGTVSLLPARMQYCSKGTSPVLSWHTKRNAAVFIVTF